MKNNLLRITSMSLAVTVPESISGEDDCEENITISNLALSDFFAVCTLSLDRCFERTIFTCMIGDKLMIADHTENTAVCCPAADEEEDIADAIAEQMNFDEVEAFILVMIARLLMGML